MRKYLKILFGVIATGIIVYTFVAEGNQYDIFGIEMSVWIYRMIWVLIAVSSFYRAFSVAKDASE